MIERPRHQNKKLALLLLFAASLVASSGFSQGWQVVNFPTADNITGAWFTAPDTGYLVGNTGKVARTVDGGKTWGGVQLTKHALEDIFIADKRDFYVCGSSGTIIMSNDAGRNWVERSLQDTSITLISIRRIGSGLLLATGLTHDSTRQNVGVLLRSTDNGLHWNKPDVTGLGFGELLISSDNKARFLSWGSLYVSSDLGETWRSVALSEGKKPGRTLDMKGNIGIIIGNFAKVALTEDRGKSWNEVMLPKEDAHFTSVLMLDEKRAYIAGYNSRMYRTSDGGRTWTRETLPVVCDIYALTKAGNRLWAVGAKGVVLRKSIN